MAAQITETSSTQIIDSLSDDVRQFCNDTHERVQDLVRNLLDEIARFNNEVESLTADTDKEKKKTTVLLEKYQSLGEEWANLMCDHKKISDIYESLLGTINNNNAIMLDLSGNFNQVNEKYNNGIQHSWRGLRDNYKIQNNVATIGGTLSRLGRYLSDDPSIVQSTLKEFGKDEIHSSFELIGSKATDEDLVFERDDNVSQRKLSSESDGSFEINSN